MDLASFCSLLVLVGCLSVTVASVEPPSNVSLRCHNLQNILVWDYGTLLPGIKFKVNIFLYDGNPQVLWVEPPALQADVSFLNDSRNDYLLEVVAVIGQNESNPAPPDGITFSYFQHSQSFQKCSLDLPPVNVTTQQDDQVLVRFIHPWLWHHQMLVGRVGKKKSKFLPVFKYEVVVSGQKQYHYSCSKSVCQEILPVEAAQGKHCLNITGEVERMAVKCKQLYCAMSAPQEKQNNDIYIIISTLSFIAVVFIFILLYKKMTRPSTTYPKSMSITTKKQNIVETVREQFPVATVEPSSPTPLLPSSLEENESPPTYMTEPDFRLPIGLSNRKIDKIAVAEERHLNGEGHGYMEGRNLEEHDIQNFNAHSGYEKREQVVVEIGQDELAEGYRTRNP